MDEFATERHCTTEQIYRTEKSHLVSKGGGGEAAVIVYCTKV